MRKMDFNEKTRQETPQNEKGLMKQIFAIEYFDVIPFMKQKQRKTETHTHRERERHGTKRKQQRKTRRKQEGKEQERYRERDIEKGEATKG